MDIKKYINGIGDGSQGIPSGSQEIFNPSVNANSEASANANANAMANADATADAMAIAEATGMGSANAMANANAMVNANAIAVANAYANAHANGDCTVGSWSSWSSCTARCNGGRQGRSRSVASPRRTETGRPCPPLRQSRRCNSRPCPSDGG